MPKLANIRLNISTILNYFRTFFAKSKSSDQLTKILETSTVVMNKYSPIVPRLACLHQENTRNHSSAFAKIQNMRNYTYNGTTRITKRQINIPWIIIYTTSVSMPNHWQYKII